MDLALNQDVIIEKGIVTEGIEVFNEIFKKDDNDQLEEVENKECYFINEENMKAIFDIVDHLFLTHNELRERLNKLNGEQTIEYLIHLYKASLKPRPVDCSKALVFVMGNLDEVYSMNRNFNPDINADEFHRQSLKITITEVKTALLNRFRSEQIARLGNNHIIYPAFNEQ